MLLPVLKESGRRLLDRSKITLLRSVAKYSEN